MGFCSSVEMQEWKQLFRDWLTQPVFPEPGPVRLLLRDPAALSAALSRVLAQCRHGLLIVTADSSQAEQLCLTLPVYQQILGDERALRLVPEVEMLRRHQWQPDNEAARCAALAAAGSPEFAVFVASATALLTPAVAPTRFAESMFTLHVGAAGLGPEELAARLVQLDYDNEVEVNIPGEFARRGGILDVFSPLQEVPVRIEFLGDSIESMRLFHADTQRSFREVDAVRIAPRGAMLLDVDAAAPTCVWDYFADTVAVAVTDPDSIRSHLDQYGGNEAAAHWERVLVEARRVVYLEPDFGHSDARAEFPVLESDGFTLGGELGTLLPELAAGAVLWHWQQLRDHLCRWHGQGYRIVACCGGEGELHRFREQLAEDPQTAGLPVILEHLDLDAGLMLPATGLVLLSEKELFGRRPDVRRRRAQPYQFDMAPRDGPALEDGGYAVHAVHGICLYHGIRDLEVNGELQEVMDLEFADEARLYVPLEQAHLVGRYLGGSRKVPRLSRLGGSVWKKAKGSAAAAARDLAAELLRLEALRQRAGGMALVPVADWERSFAAAFPYTETPDQAAAVAEVLADMARVQPMDRLLCGDVGYGKTEVAMRAAFRAVLNDKQVAVLVPTTVLAQQHFITFRERMAEYPVEIEMLSRFRTPAEQRAILERVALGRTDITIGTHRLLQRDVTFHDLGLVIIDEEQRFGVNHKQRLKELRASVDILTMTATPIPRTLYLSIAGLRHLSTIMTPPAERLPVTTVVAQFDWDLVRQAVRRELERQGQVFFLYNRVQTIERMARRLRQLVPEARIDVAHGQMPAENLEHVMARFLRGDTDLLVCTTIIESGLDIANCNTILIDRADRFGLADLYQLRGRVGRYHHQAYAYLLLPPMGALPRNARERLTAIRRYTHLGAGFKLALRDLEIRGAGNILGTEQSGHIAAVGFDLYCQLLKEAVARLEQRPSPRRRPLPVDLDTLVFGHGDGAGRAAAAVPPDFVEAEAVRIDCYRRLHDMQAPEEVDAFAAELRDRFGELPTAMHHLLLVTKVRIGAGTAALNAVTVRNRTVLLETECGLVKDGRGRLPRLRAVTAAAQLRELAALIGRCRVCRRTGRVEMRAD